MLLTISSAGITGLVKVSQIPKMLSSDFGECFPQTQKAACAN
jgi:hypothetical protein